VYVQEVSGGVRPLDAASTSTAAFVGLAEMGPDTGATLITNWTEFQRLFGGFIDDGYLAHGVFQFFNNGGRQCYILRVTRSDAAVAATTVLNRAATAVDGLVLRAKSKGDWGNYLYVQISTSAADPGNQFRLAVRRQDDAAVVPVNFADLPALEVFDNLGMDPNAPNYVVDVLRGQSSLIDAAVPTGNTTAQAGFHRGGAGATLPLAANLTLQVNVDGDGFQTVTLPQSIATSTSLTDVGIAIAAAVKALTRRKNSTDPHALSDFACRPDPADNTRLVLTSGMSSLTSSVAVLPGPAGTDACTKLRLGPGAGWSEGGGALRRPRAGLVQIGDATPGQAPVSATAPLLGTDGTARIDETSFANAFNRLANITDASLLAVPGEGTSAMTGEGMSYCARRPLQDMFYIGEMGPLDEDVAAARTFRSQIPVANSYGAVYFPWVLALDPTGRSTAPVPLPPSGYIAGLYARTDGARGVWKAPAGVQASLNGAVGLTTELSDTEHGILNQDGIDVIRRFPGAGIVSFGARTITSDPAWRYVPVRRTAIMLRVSIYYGIQWAVFEPNDEPLWSQLRLTIGSFMTTLFRQGAFQGASPADAFFVKCDAETTTQADIDAGVVNVLVGFAALKPAEFVVVRISQKAGQASG
jgi:phage tail sheath protein FI